MKENWFDRNAKALWVALAIAEIIVILWEIYLFKTTSWQQYKN
jgi:hypothetical protein